MNELVNLDQIFPPSQIAGDVKGRAALSSSGFFPAHGAPTYIDVFLESFR